VPAAETEPVKNRSVGRSCGAEWILGYCIQIQVEWAARLASRDLPTAQRTHMQDDRTTSVRIRTVAQTQSENVKISNQVLLCMVICHVLISRKF
jgi:hypothetical protein